MLASQQHLTWIHPLWLFKDLELIILVLDQTDDLDVQDLQGQGTDEVFAASSSSAQEAGAYAHSSSVKLYIYVSIIFSRRFARDCKKT